MLENILSTKIIMIDFCGASNRPHRSQSFVVHISIVFLQVPCY